MVTDITIVVVSAAAQERITVVSGEIVFGAARVASEESDAGVSAKSAKGSSAKKSRKSGVVEAAAESDAEQHRIQVLRALVESLIQRVAAFSAVLLSEAVRALSPSTCTALLRVFAYTLRGLSTRTNDTTAACNTQNLGRFGDDQIRRAVTWMEALLDAHFSATAMQAAVHAPTRRALTCAMQVVSGADTAADQVESAMGLWTHITRVAHHGSEQTKPIPGLYKLEQLSF